MGQVRMDYDEWYCTSALLQSTRNIKFSINASVAGRYYNRLELEYIIRSLMMLMMCYISNNMV